MQLRQLRAHIPSGNRSLSCGIRSRATRPVEHRLNQAAPKHQPTVRALRRGHGVNQPKENGMSGLQEELALTRAILDELRNEEAAHRQGGRSGLALEAQLEIRETKKRIRQLEQDSSQ
jgi:hypothetical protein